MIRISVAGEHTAYGPCQDADINLIVTKDTAVFQTPGHPAVKYYILGLSPDRGLHCLREDSSRMVMFKYHEKDDSTRSITHDFILIKQVESTYLIFASPKCPDLGK